VLGLTPESLLAAYRLGIFPMPEREGDVAWWSPDPRGIVPLDGLHVSRSLRRSLPRFEVTVDAAFDDVIAACANRGEGDWIDDDIRDAYCRLHRLGWAHSVEVWASEPRRLAGGVYGVAIGGLFAGESMFHRERDASKVALVALVDLLRAGGDIERRLFDVQWLTPHLASLGAVEVPRAEYLARLAAALELPLPPALVR
jgi:leucyl/phenylalanyl-tRNA--protein transferase